MNHTFNRRQCLAVCGAAAVAASQPESVRGYFANDTIAVACLGNGGRFNHLLPRLQAIPGIKVVGVCDVQLPRMADAKTKADKNAVAEIEYRKLLDRSDVDAVMIASPDHWHVPMTIDACAAGKDVYVEKPLTHNIAEGAAVLAAQNEHQRIVQVGTQQRSMPHLIEARERVLAGALGKVYKIDMSWNRNSGRFSRAEIKVNPADVRWDLFCGNAPSQPLDPYKMLNWRWFWDFGGGILTDLMVHWLDTAHWMLGLKAPQAAVTIGSQFKSENLWETPDTVQTLLDYPDDSIQAHFEGTFLNHHRRAQLTLMGEQATLVCDRGAYEIIPERGSSAQAILRNDSTNPLRGLDFYDDVDGEGFHLKNWIDCVRTRRAPNCPVEEGVGSAAAAHLANQAYRTQSRAKM